MSTSQRFEVNYYYEHELWEPNFLKIDRLTIRRMERAIKIIIKINKELHSKLNPKAVILLAIPAVRTCKEMI